MDTALDVNKRRLSSNVVIGGETEIGLSSKLLVGGTQSCEVKDFQSKDFFGFSQIGEENPTVGPIASKQLLLEILA